MLQQPVRLRFGNSEILSKENPLSKKGTFLLYEEKIIRRILKN